MKKSIYVIAVLGVIVVAAGVLVFGKRLIVGSNPITVARTPVIQLLKDPDSVQFRNERVQSDGVTVCGEFNAKNSLGGYVGFRLYVSNSKHFLIEKSNFKTWPLEAVPVQAPDGFSEAISKAESNPDLMQMIYQDVWQWYWSSLCKQGLSS